MNETVEKWVRRAMTAALVALAFGLVVMGVALYAPAPHGRTPSGVMVR